MIQARVASVGKSRKPSLTEFSAVWAYNTKDVLREAATRSGEREAAREHTQTLAPHQPVREQAREVLDLHAHTVSKPAKSRAEVVEYEKALRARAAEKYPDPSPELATRIERNIARRVQEHAKAAEIEQAMRKKAAELYPNSTKEQAAWIEKQIARRVQEAAQRAKLHKQPMRPAPAARTRQGIRQGPWHGTLGRGINPRRSKPGHPAFLGFAETVPRSKRDGWELR